MQKYCFAVFCKQPIRFVFITISEQESINVVPKILCSKHINNRFKMQLRNKVQVRWPNPGRVENI